jgi:predicted metal-dependent peptidase
MATDGNKIYYHPEFVKGLTNDEIYGVLLHEISHCIYNHCGNKRRMNRSVHRFNVACDFAVNLEIKDMGYSLPPNLLLDNKYREMNAEQIYDLLPEDCDNFTTLDIHIDNGDEGSWDDMEEKILTAWEATKDSTSRGATPAGIKRWIDKIRKSRVKWERIFHRYVGQALAKDDYSFTRVNKRFLGQGLYLPDLRSYSIGNVIIAVDTSGSISKEQIECFAAEIKKLSSLIESITVITCDAEVHEVVKLNKFEDFTKKLYFKGGGGTSHKPVFNKIKELNLNPELFIGLTDLYSDINDIKKPLYPVIWVSTSEISTAHFGHVVQLPRGKNDW